MPVKILPRRQKSKLGTDPASQDGTSLKRRNDEDEEMINAL